MDSIFRETKLARGILIKGNQVLLAKDIRPDQGHYFLPGGHVELKESIKTSLKREWAEELGWDIEVNDFVGCLEHSWNYFSNKKDKLVEVFETNFIFKISVIRPDYISSPVSKENHLSFSWEPISNLKNINLLPRPMGELIVQASENKKFGLWQSTI